MALVTVRIGGTPHTVGCKDGQEAHLEAMAAEVDRRVQALAAQVGSPSPGTGVPGAAGEGRLFVLAALMLADELHDCAAELDQTRRLLQQKPREVVREVVREVPVEVPVPDSVYARKLESLAARAEEIAAGLERA
jgi:cell division protein ZapA